MADKKILSQKQQENSWSRLPNIDRESRFHVKIVEKIKISKDLFIIALEKPKDFVFIPCQYIWLVLPELTKYFGVIDRKSC